jgi:hypothetical protein
VQVRQSLFGLRQGLPLTCQRPLGYGGLLVGEQTAPESVTLSLG